MTMDDPLLRGYATDEPVVPWLNGVHEYLLDLMVRQPVVTLWVGDRGLLRARIEMERKLLDPHVPADGRWARLECQQCSRGLDEEALRKGDGSWPCEVWLIIAAAWRPMGGYREEWAL